MIIYEIIGDDEEDLLSMATNGSEEPHGQAIMPVTQPATLPYKPAGGKLIDILIFSQFCTVLIMPF